MIALSSFVRFHAARTPDRPALAYAGFVVRSELPRNPSGKILKRVLREEVASATKGDGNAPPQPRRA